MYVYSHFHIVHNAIKVCQIIAWKYSNNTVMIIVYHIDEYSTCETADGRLVMYKYWKVNYKCIVVSNKVPTDIKVNDLPWYYYTASIAVVLGAEEKLPLFPQSWNEY